jgi:subtilisin family serine protease
MQRFVYGLCFLILIFGIVRKIKEEDSLSPHVLVEASEAQTRHLDGKGVFVAVLDEGFDSSHPSLKNQLSTYQYNTDNKRRDASESLVFEGGKYQFTNHGTHVSGIIASLAPQAQIIPIKLGLFGGDQAFVRALHIAANSPAQIVNISMRLTHTGRELSPNVRQALIQLAKAGKLIVIAAGNESAPLMANAYTRSLVDLSLDPLVEGHLLLAGASSYKNGKEILAEFSNYPGQSAFGMAQAYFLTAPGDRISSAITGGFFGEKSGTSMAAPMIVGVACLLKQAFPCAQAETLAYLLLKSARKTSLDGKDLPRTQFGAGIVNLKSALEQGKGL